MVDEASTRLLFICSHEVWVKVTYDWPTALCLSLCLCRPSFTSQSYDISISTNNELVRFSCAYAYAYVDPVFTCLHICLSLCLCASENQALALTSPLRLSGRASGLVNVTRGQRFDSCCDYSEFFLGAACDTESRFKRRATAVPN